MKYIKRLSSLLRIKLFPTIQDRELVRWYRDRGEQNKRFDYPLNQDSVVIDFGGFDGQWASDLFSRYLSEIHVFEAMPEFAKNIASRFSCNSKIKIYPFAVGSMARIDEMIVEGVGSSMFRTGGGARVRVQVEDVRRLFEMCDISRCDLLKINIEGGEYEVLPRLIESGLIEKIDNLQIQFHRLDGDSSEKVRAIRSALAKTHEMMWQYEWVWEGWRRKV